MLCYKGFIKEKDMVTFAIILFGVGLMILPLGEVVGIIMKKKDRCKFSNERFSSRFKDILRLASITICVIAILIIYFQK